MRRRPGLRPWVCGTRMRTWLRRWLSRMRPWLWGLRRLRRLLLVDRGREGLLETQFARGALTLGASVLSEPRAPPAAQESVPGERPPAPPPNNGRAT
jgi:hypothetical protein